jgi:hypothetical protein
LWGLAGRLVYALERPRARTLVGTLVDRILAAATRQREGVAWRADARFIGTPPAGGDTLIVGVAHGTPGIVAALAAFGDERARATALAGMAWVWAQRAVSSDAAFPDVAGAPPYRIHGWCYGDEGIGAVLYAAARSLGDERWQARWLEILAACAHRRPSTERGLTLCHGAAGMAHLWHRVYQTTGDALFREAALAWLDATLAGLVDKAAPWPGLLDGTAGIALALAAFVNDVEPAWDRLFALSLRATPE